MQRILPFFILLIVLIGTILDSCVSHDLGAPCDEVLTLKDDIHPIVMNRCVVNDCHGSDPDLPDWSDTTLFKENVSLVRQKVSSHEMPPENVTGLTDDERHRIVCWADQMINN
jgi:uncharacterized membrane protein